MTEHFNAVLRQRLRRLPQKYGDNWDECIDVTLFALHGSVHESTRFTPSELMLGHTLREQLDVIEERCDKDQALSSTQRWHTWQTCTSRWNRTSRRRLRTKNEMRAKLTMAAQYDQKAKQRELKVGDLVLILYPLPLAACWHAGMAPTQ